MEYQVYLDVTFKWQVSDIFSDLRYIYHVGQEGSRHTLFSFNSSSCSWFFQKETGSGDKLPSRLNSTKGHCGSLLNLHFLR